MFKFYYERTRQTLFRNQYPDIIKIIPANFSEGVVYNTHRHEHSEILFLMDGKSEQFINNKKYIAKKGDLIILNKGSLHAEQSSAEDSVKIISCVLDNVLLNGLEDNLVIPADVKPVIDCSEYYTEITNIFKELYYDEISRKQYSYELAQLNITKIFYYIYRILEVAPKEKSRKTFELSNLSKMVKEYLDENYNREISLEDLSNKFFISSYHIVHEMKKELGMSPINYLINRRIGEAQRYLLFSDKSVNDISELVGYGNVSYFNKLFQKKTGHTPAHFREIYMTNRKADKDYTDLDNMRRLEHNDKYTDDLTNPNEWFLNNF